MKLNNILPIVILIGVTILFFFPEPEENFLLYGITFLGVIIIIILLLIKINKKN